MARSNTIWKIIWVLAILAIYTILFKPGWLVVMVYAENCDPTPTVIDPCKEGQCFGYPHGICESNPNQSGKEQSLPDPNRPYYDLWGNKFDYMGNLIKLNCPRTDPVSHSVNPFCPIKQTKQPIFIGK